MDRNNDEKGRWRNKCVTFRVSEEEAQMIDHMVAISGLRKQDYIVRKLTNRDVIVHGNPKVYKALRNRMEDITTELKRLSFLDESNEEMVALLKEIFTIMDRMRRDTD